MLVGSDPEVLICNKDGKIVSAVGKVGGTKEFPRKVAGGHIQEDNVMAEMNPTPAATKQEFIDNLTTVMGSLTNVVNGRFYEQVTLSLKAHGLMAKWDVDNAQARMFGCETDFCGWSEEENDPVIIDTVDRYCGGHLHISTAFANIYGQQINLAKYCDLYLGVPSVLMDEDTERYKVYGRAGHFRFKDSYPGIEYRTLSNFWIHSPELMGWVWDQVERSVNMLKTNTQFLPQTAKDIQHCINNKDKTLAAQLVNKHNLEVVGL